MTFLVGLTAIVLFRSELKRWLYLQSWPTSLKHIYGTETSNGKEVICFDENFRASIPIYSRRGRFYTPFDFEQKKIVGKTTIYLSPSGDDANEGLLPAQAKKTIESAIQAHAKTIILQEGNYRAGVNFKNGTAINNVSLIGEGRVVIDNMGANPLMINGSVFIRNIEFINGNWGSLRTYIENPQSVCTYVKCKFNHSLVDNEDVGKAKSLGGLRIQGGTHYIYMCEASLNGYDGFSYHAAPDGSDNAPHVVEVECKAFSNGNQNSYESNNASTAHDGTKIVRLNCVYGSSHGGNVADVHEKTVSYNIGCKSVSVLNLGDNFRQYQANYFCASGALMYLIGCESNKSFYDLSSWNKGLIYTDKYFNKQYKDKSGTIKLLQ